MASSFRLNSQSYQGRYMYLACEQQEKNVVTNTSPVKWTLTVTGGSSSYYTTGPTTVTINGKVVYYKGQVSWKTYQFPAAAGSVSGVITIPHDELGNAVVEVSIRTNIYTGVLETRSGTWELDPIARYANITKAPNFTDESNPQITYANYAGDKVDSLQAAISIDGKTALVPYRNIPVAGTTYTFQLTNAERDLLLSAASKVNSLPVIFLLKTRIEDAEGVTKANSTMKIVNASPAVNPEIVDTNTLTSGITGDSSVLVALHSLAKVSINASAKKKASIVSRKVEQGETVLNGDGTFLVSSADPIRITVTDSRGNTISLAASNEIVPYLDPTCIIEHALPDANGEMLLSVIGNAYNGQIGNTQNTLTVQYRHRVGYGEYGEWATISNLSQDGNEYAAAVLVTGLDYKSRHTFQARVVDSIHADGVVSAEQTFIAEPTFDWSENDFNFNVPVTMSGHQIKELADPEDEEDAINLKYLEGSLAPYAKKSVVVTEAGTNLNNYTVEGWYFFTSSAVTPINIPAGINGWLHVLSNTGTNGLAYTKQIFCRLGTPGTNDYQTFVRTYAENQGWGAWTRYTTEKDTYRKVKLWENANLSNAFNAQTIALDLSGYDGVEILYYVDKSTNVYFSTGFLKKGLTSVLSYTTASAGYRLHRNFTINSNGIQFQTATNTGASAVSGVCIPYIIYGIKGVS